MVCLHIYVYICVSACACAGVHAHLYGAQKLAWKDDLNTLHYSLSQAFNWTLSSLIKPASSLQGYPVPASQGQGLEQATMPTQHLSGSWGIKLLSLWLWGKCFIYTDWIIFPAPRSSIFLPRIGSKYCVTKTHSRFFKVLKKKRTCSWMRFITLRPPPP